jgi:hypothetical protein
MLINGVVIVFAIFCFISFIIDLLKKECRIIDILLGSFAIIVGAAFCCTGFVGYIVIKSWEFAILEFLIGVWNFLFGFSQLVSFKTAGNPRFVQLLCSQFISRKFFIS